MYKKETLRLLAQGFPSFTFYLVIDCLCQSMLFKEIVCTFLAMLDSSCSVMEQ